MKRSLVVVKAGSTFADIAAKHGDFEDWVEGGLQLPKDRVRVIDVPSGEPLPGSDSTAAVVVTGAHEMVTDGALWIQASAEWLRGLLDERVPVLGICYGHQLLARALGGEVGYHPRGREVGTVMVSCNSEGREDTLLGILPPSFPAYASHAQSVLELPPEAVRLASSDFDSNHAFRVGDRAWGVQFHPEFSEAVMRCYIGKQREELAKQGQDADRISRDVQPSPAGRLLQRFGRLAFSVFALMLSFVAVARSQDPSADRIQYQVSVGAVELGVVVTDVTGRFTCFSTTPCSGCGIGYRLFPLWSTFEAGGKAL